MFAVLVLAQETGPMRSEPNDPGGLPAPTYGTARRHGLEPGVVVIHYGYTRDDPSRTGVRLLWLGGPHGQGLLDSGEFFDCGRPQVKFWATVVAQATQESRERALAALGGGGAAQAPPRVDVARRTLEEATGPVHPGVRWLVLLEDAGLSQSQAARQMGVSPMTLSRYINGQGIPTARVVVEFARVVGGDLLALWREVCDYELAVALEAPLQV